jgi:hypothetical protein
MKSEVFFFLNFQFFFLKSGDLFHKKRNIVTEYSFVLVFIFTFRKFFHTIKKMLI